MDDGVETPLKRRKVERTPNKSIKRRSSTDKCLPSSPRSPFIPSSQTTNNTIKKRSPSPISSSSSPYSPHSPHSPHPSHSCYSYPSTPTHIASPPAHAISPQNSPNPLSIIRLSKKSSPNPYLNFAPVSVSPLLSPANPVPLSPNLSNATYTPNTTTTSTPFKFHSGKHPPEVISVKTIPPDEWKENFTPTTKTKTKAKQSTTKPKLNEKLKAKLDFSQIIVPISNEQPTTPPKPKHCTQPHTHEFGQFDSEKHCLGCRCNLTTGMLCSTKSGCGCFWVESECSSLCLCRNGPRCLKNSLKQAIKVDTKIFQKPNGVCGVRSMQTIPPFTLIIKCDQTKHINGQFSTPQDRHFVLVNSSTTPNASRESWFDSTGSYVGLFSCKTIKKGEEITTFA